jgi:prepilin-type processing-associated H-X9-DG protein
MLMFLAGIVGIGVTHEVVWLATSKEPLAVSGLRGAYRTMSTNHLKQLGISAHSFHDIEKRLPAGATFDAQGRALHGWQTYLLPYVEQGDTFKKIDLAIPWNHPANAPTMYFNIQLFTNPAVYQPDSKDFAPSHYAGNVHVLGATPLKLNEIADGTTNTILAGEVAQNLKPWGMPMNCRDPAAGLHGPTGFGHPHGKQVQFLFADGSVRSLRGDISPGVLKALATPRGGEQIVHSDFD